jgi:hypothetical protein
MGLLYFLLINLKGYKVRVMDQMACRKLLTVKAWVRSRASPVPFVMDKVALGPLFVPVLRFSPVNITPMLRFHLYLIRGKAEEAWEPPKKAILFQISMRNAQNTL